jgi:hypothetical protein
MADDVFLSSTNFYAVVSDRDVVLRVFTGDEQVSGTSLLLNGSPVPFDSPAGPQVIGQGKDLVGSVLTVNTTVRDVNPATNHTSVTHVLEGGLETRAFPHAIDVSADKGTAHYLVTFVFTA